PGQRRTGGRAGGVARAGGGAPQGGGEGAGRGRRPGAGRAGAGVEGEVTDVRRPDPGGGLPGWYRDPLRGGLAREDCGGQTMSARLAVVAVLAAVGAARADQGHLRYLPADTGVCITVHVPALLAAQPGNSDALARVLYQNHLMSELKKV